MAVSTSSASLSDDHVPVSAEVFLDTSIHCSQLKGPLFTERIARVLRLFRWRGTSTYAKVEFGNVVLAQAQYYLRKLQELGSLRKLKDFIGNVLPHTYHQAKVVWSFSLLEDHYGQDDAECSERARLSLRRLMKQGVSLVERSCDSPLKDGTKCYWAIRGVQKKRNGDLLWQSPVCNRDHKRCRVDDFFIENREIFVKIQDAIDELPEDKKSDQLRAFSAVISKALSDPQCLLDYKTGCRRLADAIIAVDSVGFRSMFSQNSAESTLLTQVLGQVFYYLPPNPDRGVEIFHANNTSTVSG